MKRDFSNESYFNYLLRIKRAVIIRIRGYLYYFMSTFCKGTSYKITIGRYPRFINSKFILLHENTNIGNYARLECFTNHTYKNEGPKIIIGKNSNFGDLLHIGAINKVTIGQNVLGGSKILIIDHDHGKGREYLKEQENIPPRNRELISKGEIFISDNVWIGEGVIILANSTIGEGSIIAAGSIVKGNVPPFSVFFKS